MMGKEGSAWRVRGFLTPPGRSQPSARSRQNLRPRSEARNPETRANWALCRIVAQSQESKTTAAADKKKIDAKYPSSVLAVLKGDYPPPWARLELMRRALNRAAQPSGDSTAVAFRDLGVSVLANLQVMHSDLMSGWIGTERQ